MKKLISKIFHTNRVIDNHRIKKVLFIKLFAIGDCLNSTPALRALRKGLPNTQIDVRVGAWSEAVFRNNPHQSKQQDGLLSMVLSFLIIETPLRDLLYSFVVYQQEQFHRIFQIYK